MLMQTPKIIEALLHKTGWNQTKLGAKLLVTQPTISRWLDGKMVPERDQWDRIINLAKKLEVVPRDEVPRPVPLVGFVGAGGEIIYETGQGPFGEAPIPPIESDSSTVAVLVRGESMAGLEDGWYVYYDNRYDPPTEQLIGKLCVVGLTDGRILLKKLLPGRQPGRFDLYSFNAPPQLDQPVQWAAPVTWIRPQ